MIGTKPLQAAMAIALLCATSRAAALDRLVTCVPEIQPQAIKIVAGAGWVPRVEAPLKLHSAGMSGGPPGSMQVRPGREVRRDAGQVSTAYGFNPDERPNHVWLDCRYGEGGEISISRRLDERTRECTITMFKPAPGEPRRIDMKCT